MVSPKKSVSLSAETCSRIEEGLRDWSNASPEERQRYEAAAQKWEKVIRPLENAVVASEQITQKDLAIQINTRD